MEGQIRDGAYNFQVALIDVMPNTLFLPFQINLLRNVERV